MDAEFTKDELIEAFRAALGAEDQPEGALTFIELHDAVGMSERKLYRLLGKLVGDGTVETVRVPSTNIAGVRTTKPAYRLTTPATE